MPDEEQGCVTCTRCGSTARFRGQELLAMRIPRFELRLEELRRRQAELVALIEAESGKGEARSMVELRSLHEKRQQVLSEYSFLSYFQQFVDRW
jgi:DNA-binding NtrC family response regulator